MKLVVLAVVFGVSFAYPSVNSDQDKWISFKNKFQKEYESDVEEEFRFKIFVENIRKFEVHNRKYEKGLVTYRIGINQFADLLNHEFKETLKGVSKRNFFKYSNQTYIFPGNLQVPDQVDWRQQGAVTEVKNQGSCGSCWAFSTTGTIEGCHFIKTGQLVSLSEQNLVDCDVNNGACKGGFPEEAINFVKENNGIDTEESYPYTGAAGTCNFNTETVGATVTGVNRIQSGNEDDLKKSVSMIPVSVIVDGYPLKSYVSGIFDTDDCSTENLNHAVLVVGYGTENGVDYWIIKNSWSTNWGMEGYALMARNKNNQCGIASDAVFPSC